MTSEAIMSEEPWICHRCGGEMRSGRGEFYVVKIHAYADPSGPAFEAEDLRRDAHAEIDRLIEELSDLSDQEVMDQVYRRLTIYLCVPCYRRWIENPTG
jgi:hypothetical protein